MIPSNKLRKIVFSIIVLALAVTLLWIVSLLPFGADYQSLVQTLSLLVLLFCFYALAPVSARFLAPVASNDPVLSAKLKSAINALENAPNVFLYDHPAIEANTVGITRHASRVYVTTGLVDCISEAGLVGVLAHEKTHIEEKHILLTCLSACAFSAFSAAFPTGWTYGVFLLLFVGCRRWLEYRADSGAVALVGKDNVLAYLHQLMVVYPQQAWARYLVILNFYPTLKMRIRAVVSGKRALF